MRGWWLVGKVKNISKQPLKTVALSINTDKENEGIA